MCTFLAINTASIQLVPTTAIGLLAIAGSTNPTAIVPTAFLATCCALTCGVLSARLMEKLPMFRLPDLPRTMASDRERDATTATQTTTVELEKIEARPLTRAGRSWLTIFGLCFVAMFVMLAFPAFASTAIQRLGLKLPPAPPDLADKGVLIRSLFAVSILAVPFLLSFFPRNS